MLYGTPYKSVAPIMRKQLLSFLSRLFHNSGAIAQVGNNKILELEFAAETTVRTGVPADSPEKLLEAFSAYFSRHPNVKIVRLGLVEFIPSKEQSIFSYVVGVDASTDEDRVINELKEIALASPMGRWPVMIVSLKTEGHLFTKEALYIYPR